MPPVQARHQIAAFHSIIADQEQERWRPLHERLCEIYGYLVDDARLLSDKQAREQAQAQLSVIAELASLLPVLTPSPLPRARRPSPRASDLLPESPAVAEDHLARSRPTQPPPNQDRRQSQ